MGEVFVREAQSDDSSLLWDFLAYVSYEANAQAAQRVPVIAAYLKGWGMPGDFGCVAELDGTAVGAAWARQFEPKDKSAIYAGQDVPEIVIAVRPEVRSQGIGTCLLDWLEQAARERGCHGLCLTVRDMNPVVGLYERLGYQRVPNSEYRNRIGGLSFGMLLRFTGEL